MPDPDAKSADQGKIFDTEGNVTWKHHVPLLPITFPYGMVIIITIREICEWVTSLGVEARTAFDLFPVEPDGKHIARKKRDSPNWLIKNRAMLDSHEHVYQKVIFLAFSNFGSHTPHPTLLAASKFRRVLAT